jgi:hypothetical protein
MVHDLSSESGGKAPGRGYAWSLLACQDLVMVQTRGPGPAVAAFRPSDGSLAWRKQS